MAAEGGAPNGRWSPNTQINIGTLIQTVLVVLGGAWAVFQVQATIEAQVASINANLTQFENTMTGEVADIRTDLRQQSARMDSLRDAEIAAGAAGRKSQP